MAAIGEGWATDAWVQAGWVTGAWATVAVVLQFLRPLRAAVEVSAPVARISKIHFRLRAAAKGGGWFLLLRRRRR